MKKKVLCMSLAAMLLSQTGVMANKNTNMSGLTILKIQMKPPTGIIANAVRSGMKS